MTDASRAEPDDGDGTKPGELGVGGGDGVPANEGDRSGASLSRQC